VSKISADGSQLLYSTYLGGSDSAVINGLALDANGSVYVTGETNSVDFPTTPGVIQEHPGKRHCIAGCTDAFVSKLAPSGSALVYSTYLYGELDDAGNAIAVDTAGNAYVVGQTVSRLFPIVDAFQSSNRGLDDAFVVKLNADATRLLYASYLGGSRSGDSPSTGSDTGTDIAIDAAGNAYVAGYTLSYDLPTTPGAFQAALGGGVCDYFGGPCGDAFLARISAGGPGVTPPIHLAVTPTEVAPGGTIDAAWAGNPHPSANDYLRLFALGSAGDEFEDAVIYWPTPNAAAGELLLLLPADLAEGWYELRLLSPDPGSGLAVPIARSEPIRIRNRFTLNIDASTDASKNYDPRTDGMIVLRYLFGTTGPELIAGVLDATAKRTDPAAIKTVLDAMRPALDVDGNGTADALTDGLLITRYMAGLRGSALIAGAVDASATRKTSMAIEAHLQTLMP